MARILAFIGAKGGTLKTASVAAVAHVIAKAGVRVVMVDGDPQADLTSRSGFARVADPLAAEPVRVRYDGEPEMDLQLLRGGRSLEAVDVETARRHLARAAALDADLVVVDTPPALGPITTAALREAALVIIPAMPGKESLERAHDVLTLARLQPEPPAVRILLTLAHLQSNLFRWMREQVDEHYPQARMEPVVPYEMPAGEAALFEVPVTVSAPRSRSAYAYCEVAAEVLGRLRLERQTAAPGAARGVA
ncbi:MAG TPA: ParA family protein [Longimicrobiaceae bacterium]|nr:ParA family protein [Longimicrobiaceae bacterium]